MNMKKEYISPSINVIVLDSTGMLCTSGTERISPKIDTSDTETLPVKNNDVWGGEVL